MSLITAALNSGSNGNCYYIGNGTDAVLVDAGLSCRETERRMTSLGLSMQKVRAIFISHEHTDHIRGVERLSQKYQVPVYITPDTHRSGRLVLADDLVKGFSCGIPVAVGALVIMPFRKHHDAADPYSFTVSGGGVTVGVFTDLGTCCDKLVHHFRQCNAAYLEANYDAAMLENGKYPMHLKRRIRGGKGHLSNHEALELFRQHRPGFMSHLFLAHLSQENNDPRLVLDLFSAEAAGVQVSVASRYGASALCCVQEGNKQPESGLPVSFQSTLF